jgi:hypothetical protein
MEIVTALVGAILGAALGYAASRRLEKSKSNERLGGVLGLLAGELGDNRDRIRSGKTDEGWGGLTYGDWHANKTTFSELVRDESLRARVFSTYGRIYDATKGTREPPAPEELDDLAQELAARRAELLG